MVQSYEDSVKNCNEVSDLYNLALEENNKTVMEECLRKINELKFQTKKNETKCFLSNENDVLNCYIEIHAGAGGTESQDWAEMIMRMYIMWGEKKQYKIKTLDLQKAEPVGIKSITLELFLTNSQVTECVE